MGDCETFYESDGVTEKVRSIKSESKRGAYLLISDIAKMFDARPVFDGETKTVHLYSLNRQDEMLELNFGKNMTSVERKEDAENIITRLYVEGEYGDNGYVGIDDVNPTGLPYLLDFSYFAELSVFTAEHQQAVDDYIRDMQTAKNDASQHMTQMIDLDNQLNDLWGQIDYVLYVVNEGEITRTILGGSATAEQSNVADDEDITVLLSDGTHQVQTGSAFTEIVQYAIKFIQKPSATIGGKEVAVEAKQASIDSLLKELQTETDATRRQSMDEQIEALEAGVEQLYWGTDEEEGLYALMQKAAKLAVERANVNLLYLAASEGQDAIEERFALAMGDMLIDGYWSNTAYAPGQEELLYREACEVMRHLSKPSVSYTVGVQNLSGVSGYEKEIFSVNMVLRIWDEALRLNDMAYITKLVEHPDAPEKDTLTISNDLTSIGGVSLDSIISRITGIAEIVNQKKSLYDRSKAISGDGSIPAQRLEGMIDVLKTRLSSSVSNWYTDENGNLILEAVNGQSAMQLCGEGFMIASSRTEDGKWDWRTFGSGEGFTADMLVTGYLSADRIAANTITANKLASDVGQSLDLSSNKSITLKVEEAVDTAIGYRVEIYSDSGDVLSEHVQSTILRARVWHGNTEVTESIAAERFVWTRKSADATADRVWNTSHAGVKSVA